MPRTLRGRLLVTQLLPIVACMLALLCLRWHTGAIGYGWLLLIGLATALLAAALALLTARRAEQRLRLLGEAVRRLGESSLGASPSGDSTTFPGEFAGIAAAFAELHRGIARIVAEAHAERLHLAAVLERSADGVLAIDEDGDVCFLNPAAARLLTLPDHERAAGRSFVAVVRDHEVAALLQRCRASGAQVVDIVQLGALHRPVEAIFLPLQETGAWRYLGLLHDLSEVRRIEGQRRDFVANVSHELRTPLASIKAVVQVLAEGDLADPEETRAFLLDVDREVDRLAQLVEEMLELSRIESGVAPFQFAPVALDELCAEAVRRMAAQAERGGIVLQQRLAGELPPIAGDYERLLRALLNLIHNAIKFTPSGGVVTVYAHDCNGRAALGVRDTGAGIPRDELERIFERFYKVDRARSSRGTGLGLAIVKHTVQAHRGTVEVASVPGQGSDFRLLLPYD